MCVHTYVCVHVCVRSNGVFLSTSCSLALPPGRLPSWFKVSLFLSGVRVQTSCWEHFPKLLFLFEFPPFYFKKPFSFPKTKGPVEGHQRGSPTCTCLEGLRMALLPASPRTPIALVRPVGGERWPHAPPLGSPWHPVFLRDDLHSSCCVRVRARAAGEEVLEMEVVSTAELHAPKWARC